MASPTEKRHADPPLVIATRGSALALAQTRLVLKACQAAFPEFRFEIKIIKTTGDKLQAVPPDAPNQPSVKGLFTKELEIALLDGEADLAVHSLKDLPTDLPEGLALAAVAKREDARDVLIYRDARMKIQNRTGLGPHATIRDFAAGATIATSSTRRQAQLLALRADLKIVPIRGNVGTRLRKLAERAELDGLVLAAAGLNRLQVRISAEGKLSEGADAPLSAGVPEGLLGTFLTLDEMLPCVGQGAIGIEARRNDERAAAVCARLNDDGTNACAVAERAFLRGMGGGCLSPVAAHAEIADGQMRLRGVSFHRGAARRGAVSGAATQAAALGAQLAAQLK